MSNDIHGKNASTRNVLTNWGAQVVQIISGFVVPRLIDRHLSQEALGVWDLTWSIVVYFNLVSMGFTSSINRYISFHRAKEDFGAINRVVSSAAVIMGFMGVAIVLLTIAMTCWGVGLMFQECLGVYVLEARWVVFLLGISIAVQVSSAVYTSIITGLHRWDLHNGVTAAEYAAILIGMVTILCLGGTLVALAVVVVVSELLGRGARLILCYRLCPWLKIQRASFCRETALEMYKFGGKYFVSDMSGMVLSSTVNVLIVAYLGPVALAVYLRPCQLVRALGTFMHKYAMVFGPTFSSLQSAGLHEEVKALVIKSTRNGLYIVLPGVLTILFFGGEVLGLWMGRSYANHLLIVVIASGTFCQLAYIPLFKATLGLNLHGRPCFANMVAAGIALCLVWISLAVLELGIVGVAIAVACPFTLVHGVYLPLYVCRKLEMEPYRLWTEMWKTPLLCALPYGTSLFIGRLLFPESMMWAALSGGGVGVAILCGLYWRVVLPDSWKWRILGALRIGETKVMTDR